MTPQPAVKPPGRATQHLMTSNSRATTRPLRVSVGFGGGCPAFGRLPEPHIRLGQLERIRDRCAEVLGTWVLSEPQPRKARRTGE